MSDYQAPPSEPAPALPRGPWTNRVTFSNAEDGLPFAYRPHQVLTTRVDEALGVAADFAPDLRVEGRLGPFARLVEVPDPIRLVEELRLRGIVAQLNHVYFSHDSVFASPVYGSPVYGSPVYGSPVYGSPVYGSPVYGSPVYGSQSSGAPVTGGRHVGPTRSTARPPRPHTRTAGIAHRIHTALAEGSPHVFVLDTGLAHPDNRPPIMDGGSITAASGLDLDQPDEDADQYLDPAAGHGTFIAGVIAQVAPGCQISLHRVLSTFGDGDEWAVVNALESLPIVEPERTIVSLSFGGYVLDHPHAMAWALRKLHQGGVQVVASAGNDATSRPAFPAALPGVIGVGAIGPSGPAPFTNYGPWVSACAPGTDLLSTFFVFNGPAIIGPDGTDPDDFAGWALWSGTSFSGPVVVGNLARMMMLEQTSGHAAVRRVLDPVAYMRIPNLGTVVNTM